MENIQAGAVGAGGYVRAVFSRRVRGFAAPVDLMRVCLRAKRAAAERGRIGDAFRDYLVSESGQVVPVFSRSRERHAGRLDSLFVTGGGFSWCVGIGEAIDAPDLLAGGGMWRFDPAPFDYPEPAQLYAVRGSKWK